MLRILVATDLSHRSDHALARAALIAGRADASVRLLHVVDDDQPEALFHAEAAAARSLLAAQAERVARENGVPCDAQIVGGAVPDSVARAVAEHDIDLVVIGAVRVRIFRDAFVGTTADQIIRAGRRPLLMVHSAPEQPYTRALLALDGSKASAAAVGALRKLDLVGAAHVYALRVSELPEIGLMARTATPLPEIKAFIAARTARDQAELKSLLATLDYAPVDAFAVAAHDSVAATLCAVAARRRIPLIVIGTQGASGLRRFVIGSVATEVLRRTDRDMLIVPPE